jgi:drug/metabolite transporter (DMT)-like permease
MTPRARQLEATGFLILATLFWSVSFPVIRAMSLIQAETMPGLSTWFTSAVWVIYRFGGAGLIMFLWTARRLKGLTRLELEQGLGLGLFSGAGMVLQVDGLAHTSASTSAFLTQCYCLFIPVWLTVRERRWPPWPVLICCLVVFLGVAILADFDWLHFRLGRGELETMLGSVLFTGQILWLQRTKYAHNDVHRFTQVMFLVMALCVLPLALALTRKPADWLRVAGTPTLLLLLAVLIAFSTFGGFLLMNRWQRFVPATQAGLIYCAEPVFTSVLVLFLPAWLGTLAGVSYPNESVTWRLLIGGSLITAANIALTVLPPPRPPEPGGQPATVLLGRPDMASARDEAP